MLLVTVIKAIGKIVCFFSVSMWLDDVASQLAAEIVGWNAQTLDSVDEDDSVDEEAFDASVDSKCSR